MASTVWTGVLSFGLVALPVQLQRATDDHTIRFHQLQRGTADRVRYRRVNERTGEDVDYDDLVKGLPAGDDWVVIEPDELADLAPGRSRELAIVGFVEDAIDPLYYRGAYYLAPREPAYGRPYVLLREALRTSARAGIARLVLRGREHLTAVRPTGSVLAVHLLHWATDVRDPDTELGGSLPGEVDVREAEITTAVQLISAMAMDWRPQEYRDTYQDRVNELVEAKLAGHTVPPAVPPPRATAVEDLDVALRASVDQARRQRSRQG